MVIIGLDANKAKSLKSLIDSFGSYKLDINNNGYTYSIDQLEDKITDLSAEYKGYADKRRKEGLGTDWNALKAYKSALGTISYKKTLKNRELVEIGIEETPQNILKLEIWDNQKYDWIKSIVENGNYGLNELNEVRVEVEKYKNNKKLKGKANQSYSQLENCFDKVYASELRLYITSIGEDDSLAEIVSKCRKEFKQKGLNLSVGEYKQVKSVLEKAKKVIDLRRDTGLLMNYNGTIINLNMKIVFAEHYKSNGRLKCREPLELDIPQGSTDFPLIIDLVEKRRDVFGLPN